MAERGPRPGFLVVPRSEWVCSLLNVSGRAEVVLRRSQSTFEPMGVISYSCAIILNLFAAIVCEVSPGTRRQGGMIR